jgi:beta-lactamase superfamily II metal-dependent hydrolase
MQLYNSYVAATKKSSQETIYVKGRIPWDDNEGTSEINESSLIFLFEYETQRILFTGDAGKVGLSQAINFAKSRQIDLKNLTLIKMPHHGSRKNVNPQLMDQLGNDATICMISCVQGDEGHHPSKRLVNMLIEKGFTVLTTAGAAACHTYNNPPSREGYNKAESLKPYVTVESI